MCAGTEQTGHNAQNPPTPVVGAIVVDVARWEQPLVGEFRGVVGPYWMLRAPRGGTEWEVRPEHTREATPAERLAARTARENARSRGEVA
ncbi:hypothetical protein DNK56_21630 [Streptomyces sp. AC1-42W]|nr:hypothetical protein DNK56_21630 [Streptomyces sp. AC1-42W]PZT80062.1 hypothetical protein DNK55_11055 [Streptomyces sp. AC1-42T]